jgi:hypothetical protein
MKKIAAFVGAALLAVLVGVLMTADAAGWRMRVPYSSYCSPPVEFMQPVEISQVSHTVVGKQAEVQSAFASTKSRNIRDHVIQLPEDGGKWQTMVIYGEQNRNSALDQRIQTMFASDARLQSLKSQTNYYEMGPLDPYVFSNYPTLPLPAIVVSRPQFATQVDANGQQRIYNTGHVEAVYRVYKEHIPADADKLARDIQTSLDLASTSGRPCPRPTPTPTPTPQPTPQPNPNPPPVIIPPSTPDKPAPEEDKDSTVLGWIVVAAVAGVGAFLALRREVEG